MASTGLNHQPDLVLAEEFSNEYILYQQKPLSAKQKKQKGKFQNDPELD
jgi:hypothetical protein